MLSPDDCGSTHTYGKYLEWLLVYGRPFACIVNVTCLKPKTDGNFQSQKYEFLCNKILIKGLNDFDHIEYLIDLNKTKDAYHRARQLAIETYYRY